MRCQRGIGVMDDLAVVGRSPQRRGQREVVTDGCSFQTQAATYQWPLRVE